jgi:hypothetical protein
MRPKRVEGNEKTTSYDDILYLPHPTSKVHKRMPIEDRAAQFAPFSALTGHGKAIRDVIRKNQQEME